LLRGAAGGDFKLRTQVPNLLRFDMPKYIQPDCDQSLPACLAFLTGNVIVVSQSLFMGEKRDHDQFDGDGPLIVLGSRFASCEKFVLYSQPFLKCSLGISPRPEEVKLAANLLRPAFGRAGEKAESRGGAWLACLVFSSG